LIESITACAAACVGAGSLAAAARATAFALATAAATALRDCCAVEPAEPCDGNEAANGAGVAPGATGSIAVPSVWANQCLTGS